MLRRRGQGALLALLGIRFRLAGSVATLVVAVLATAAASLGPLYAGSAQDALVRSGLAAAPVYRTGLVTTTPLTAQAASPVQVIDAAGPALAEPGADRFWGAISLLVGASAQTLVLPVFGPTPPSADVSWRRGQCVSVRIVRGRCPTAGHPPGRAEAMVSARTAADGHLSVGSRLPLDLGGPADPAARAARAPVVVGVYDGATATAPGWVWDSPAQATPASVTEPAHLDEVLVDRTTMTDAQVGVQVTAFRPLRAGSVHARDTPELVRLGAGRSVLGARGTHLVVTSSVGDVVGQIDDDRLLVRTASTAVTAQLALLALFVLYLVLASTAEERGTEVALAKLRGMAPGSVAVFVLAEPVLLLVFAVPLGVLAALGLDRYLAAGLYPGSEVALDGPTLVAAGAALAGGLAAAALAARRLLATPVLGQLRRTGGRRAALARALALDTAVAAAAGAGVYELVTGSADLVGLAAPALLAVAAGLFAVRGVPALARVGVRRTRRSPRLAPFLAVRTIARRPAGSRLVVLLAAAVALAVFGIDGSVVARGVRVDAARSQVGADTVVPVDAGTPGVLLAAVRAADPTGRQAMAAASSGGVVNPEMLAVDVPRLAAVASWDPAWGGTSGAALSRGLVPPAAPPVSVRGELSVRWADGAQGPAADLQLAVRVLAATGRQDSVALGRLAPGSAGVLRAPLPDCRERPCQLLGWTFTRTAGMAELASGPTGAPGGGAAGAVSVTGLADARGPLPAASGPAAAAGRAAAGRGRWHYARSAQDLLDPTRPPAAAVSPGTPDGFVATLSADSLADFSVASTAIPAVLPALAGRDAGGAPFPSVPGVVFAQDLAGRSVLVDPLPGRGTLPRVGTGGNLVDLGTVALADPGSTPLTREQVWFAPGADRAVIMARLARLGVRPAPAAPAGPASAGTSGPADATGRAVAAGATGSAVESVAGREAQLATTGTAIGLRVYVFGAVAALLLGLGALLTAGFVAARRRSYEVAAVVALGARRRSTVAAGVLEQLAPVLLGTVIGVAAGVVAARLALPVLGSVTRGAPVPPALVLWPVVGAVALVVLAVAAVVAALGSRRVAAMGGPERLREVQG